METVSGRLCLGAASIGPPIAYKSPWSHPTDLLFSSLHFNLSGTWLFLLHLLSLYIPITIMTITTEHIAIAELVIYIPVTLLAIFVVFRHGFHKQLGWIYLCIFGIIRIAGAIVEVLSTKNPDNENDKEWALILQSIGLSPLLLSTLGLLKRM